jgi:hypothetical protein
MGMTATWFLGRSLHHAPQAVAREFATGSDSFDIGAGSWHIEDADMPVSPLHRSSGARLVPAALLRTPWPRSLAGILLALAFPLADSGGIGMRHDVPESSYLDLAANSSRYPVGPYPDFRPVAAIGTTGRLGGFEVTGSGTLVAPDWVLTAAHVVLSERRGRDFQDDLEVRFGTSASSPVFRAKVIRVATPVPPADLRPLLGGGSRYSEAQIVRAEFSDLALLQLERPVPGIAPALPDDSSEPLAERLVFIAGFGDAGCGDNPRSRSWRAADRKRAAQNILDRDVTRNPHDPDQPGGIVLFDFDNGTEERNTLSRPAKAWERLFGTGPSSPLPTQLEGASYPGDSGGPAFTQIRGQWKVVAVSGYGTGYPPDRKRSSIQYGDILVYTRVAAHAAWIRATTTPPTVVSRAEPAAVVSEAAPTPAAPPSADPGSVPPPIFRTAPAPSTATESDSKALSLTEPR